MWTKLRSWESLEYYSSPVCCFPLGKIVSQAGLQGQIEISQLERLVSPDQHRSPSKPGEPWMHYWLLLWNGSLSLKLDSHVSILDWSLQNGLIRADLRANRQPDEIPTGWCPPSQPTNSSVFALRRGCREEMGLGDPRQLSKRHQPSAVANPSFASSLPNHYFWWSLTASYRPALNCWYTAFGYRHMTGTLFPLHTHLWHPPLYIPILPLLTSS